MACETGIYRRPDSDFWWIAATLPNGQRICQSAGTCDRTEAEALRAQLKVEAFRKAKFGIKPTHTLDLKRGTAWLDHTKNGTPRGVPLNKDAVDVLEAARGKHPVFCFTYRGEPIAWEMTNSAWHTALRKPALRISGFTICGIRGHRGTAKNVINLSRFCHGQKRQRASK